MNPIIAIEILTKVYGEVTVVSLAFNKRFMNECSHQAILKQVGTLL